MPGRSRPTRTPPVVFDDAAWAEDMLGASAAARGVAEDARGTFEEDRVAIDQLKARAPDTLTTLSRMIAIDDCSTPIASGKSSGCFTQTRSRSTNTSPKTCRDRSSASAKPGSSSRYAPKSRTRRLGKPQGAHRAAGRR
jgi:hypothetical protein